MRERERQRITKYNGKMKKDTFGRRGKKWQNGTKNARARDTEIKIKLKSSVEFLRAREIAEMEKYVPCCAGERMESAHVYRE